MRRGRERGVIGGVEGEICGCGGGAGRQKSVRFWRSTSDNVDGEKILAPNGVYLLLLSR